MYRISNFNRFDLFAPERHRQREAVKWLQRKVIEANAEEEAPARPSFFARLLGSNRGPGNSYLRIADPLGVAASDLIYGFARRDNIGWLQFFNERYEKHEYFRARYDRVLKEISPFQIEETRKMLAKEQKRHSGKDYDVVFRWAQLVLARWAVIHAGKLARSNPLDAWFLSNHQAAVWDHNSNCCMKCGVKPAAFKHRTLDHAFVPLSKGGTFVVRNDAGRWTLNALPLCRRCNSAKGTRTVAEFFGADDLSRIKRFLKSFAVDLTPPARRL